MSRELSSNHAQNMLHRVYYHHALLIVDLTPIVTPPAQKSFLDFFSYTLVRSPPSHQNSRTGMQQREENIISNSTASQDS